ncbi:hypothetical protein Nekkels1_67 [Cellulophaga phage Nekkels_1]|uniref:Uncharacterized protein n=1 Tax=Cellulophaga phage Nekkels_1 TaxID=2745692 RepID=A0A8E4UXI6_9CAUD|nr:hypothetical protein M1M31_gp67 [Cellulophaga phage Nekkels_1]QQO97071.1 hypothetical protein Nekkels1_67 [Cellulophaga phage Nekkels_1]QQO97166.1 hypothetical protein Nekkels2_69 [Cellulophaga phage Nekkels_2]
MNELKKNKLRVPDVVRNIFIEMMIDEKSLDKVDKHSEDFKQGFSEAIRTLSIIIKQETEVDVRE